MVFENRIIKGRGVSIPLDIVPNTSLLTASDKWTKENLGIEARHIANKHENVADMGYFAGFHAIADAGISIHEVDAVIVSTSSPSHFAPSTACQILNRLELSVPAFDINAVCSGFIYALQLGCLLPYNNVLIIATEKYSSITDWSTRDCVYFGDGAGAVVLSRGNGRIFTHLYADGKSGDAFVAKAGETFSIQGGLVYKKALEVLPDAVNAILKDAGMTIEDIDTVVPHQAGIRVLKEIAHKIGCPWGKFITIMEKYGNLASASIPVAMCEDDGENTLLLTIGSGWTWGTAIIQKL